MSRLIVFLIFIVFASHAQTIEMETVSPPADAPVLTVFVDANTQKTYSQEALSQENGDNPLQRLHTFLKRTGMAFKISYVPWNRALSNANELPNSFIYQLLRTPEREPHYHWITKASDVEPLLLVGRKGINESSLDRDVKAGKYTAGCFLGAAQCAKLEKFGFRAARFIKTTTQDPHNLEALLINNRVDFVAVYKSEFLRGLRHYNQDESAFDYYAELDDSVDYLAAAKGKVDISIITYLQTVATQLAETQSNVSHALKD